MAPPPHLVRQTFRVSTDGARGGVGGGAVGEGREEESTQGGAEGQKKKLYTNVVEFGFKVKET